MCSANYKCIFNFLLVFKAILALHFCSYFMWVYMCICVYVYVYIYVYWYVCICVYVYVYGYVYILIFVSIQGHFDLAFIALIVCVTCNCLLLII